MDNTILFVQVQIWISDDCIEEINMGIDEIFNYKLTKIFKGPKLCFIPDRIYSEMNSSVKSECKVIELEDNDMTPDEILQEPLLYIITDENNNIFENIELIQEYTNKDLKFLIIEDLD